MYLLNLFKFSFVRILLSLITKRKKFKNKEFLYSYYTSILFQLIYLPRLTILYYSNKISYKYIILSSINYFVTDFPEIIYSKLYKYFSHHLISISILIGSLYIPDNLKKNVIINLLCMEIGSSVLSLDIFFKLNLLKPIIFGLTRLISLFNGIYMIYKTDNIKLKYILTILTILLMLNNMNVLKKLIYNYKFK